MNPHILIVEDNQITAYELKMLLEYQGYDNVETCDYGENAIKKAQKNLNIPSLYILDIGLKGHINGIEVSKKIKVINPNAEFIFVSGEEEKIRQARLIEGVRFLFSKPIDNEELINAITQLMPLAT